MHPSLSWFKCHGKALLITCALTTPWVIAMLALLLLARLWPSLVTRKLPRIVIVSIFPPLFTLLLGVSVGVVSRLTSAPLLEHATSGSDSQEAHNLDPHYRLYIKDHGCFIGLIAQSMDMFLRGQELGIKIIHPIAPAPDTYQGPYPTKAEAWAMLESIPWRTLPTDDAAANRILPAPLHRATLHTIHHLSQTGFDFYGRHIGAPPEHLVQRELPAGEIKARWASCGQDCLLINPASYESGYISESFRLILIDTRRSVIFGYYYDYTLPDLLRID